MIDDDTQGDLFGQPPPERVPGPMYRKDDRVTSVAAAHAVEPKVNELHLAVLTALGPFGTHGLTAEELEQLPQFRLYGPSTVRKRISELAQMGRISEAGTRTNSRGRSMIVWRRP